MLIFSGFFAAQTFSQTSINLDTAFVGDDGNTEDTTGYGAVSYGYYIGKYEVANSEYSAFLNAVAATDTYGLWHRSMSIERTGSSGDYSYGVVEGQAKHPVLRVNFYNAARFANWLMNGQPTGSQDSSTTETGFYTFSDATTISSQGTRSASLIDGKNWVAIASEDEWYKAAYYDPTLNSGSGGYYQYPAGSDTAPTKSAPTADLNSVNYGGSNAVGSTTVVGSYSGAPSPYGTFDQGGNVQEWTDSIPEESKRAVRGGWYNSNKSKAMLSTLRYPTDSTKKQSSIGFRVSSMATLSVEATLSADSRRYGIGDTLLIKAIWNNTVQVTGIPKLKLSNGSEAAYSSGNNTSTLVFFYEIQAGDVSANDISVEEYTGTIKNASGDPVRQISGDLGSVEIDVDSPALVGISADERKYKSGSTISISVVWAQSVLVSGTPILNLSNGLSATYSEGNGTSVLVFTLPVTEGDSANNISVISLDGVVTSEVGNPAGAIAGDLGSLSIDGVFPEISLNGDPSMSFMAVGNRDPKRFTDLGAQASDDEDGDLTSSIVITGKVDEGQPGTYTINYRVSDAAGNVAEASRTIYIVEKEKPAVIYVDNKVLPKYSMDPYLSLDIFEGHRQNGRGGEDFSRFRSGPSAAITVEAGYAGPDPDWIDLGDKAPSLNNEFTQEAWIYYDFTHHGKLMEIFGPSPFLTLYHNVEGSTQLQFAFKGKEFKNNFINNLITKTGWTHLAVTFDANGDYALYANGEEVYRRENYWTGDPPSVAPLSFIGRNFHGKIDDVRFWNVARSPEEIRNNMNSSLTGNEPGLVAYYPMDLNDNWELIDHSPNQNHAKTATTLKSELASIAGVFEGETIHNVEILQRYEGINEQPGPDGSAEYPYPTIRSALDAVREMINKGQQGHRVVIKEGRYSEVITLDSLNEDGTEGIVIEGHPEEEVILDGTLQVKAQWNDDDGDGIYQATLDMKAISSQAMTPIEAVYGLFVDGRYMIPAMPVNIKNPTDPTKGNPHNPEPGTIWSWKDEAQKQAGPDDGRLDWRNGVMKPYWYDKGLGFYFPNDITVPVSPSTPQALESYIPGDLAYLDAPEEWAFDQDTETIYLYPSEDYIPNEINVRIRVRDRFVNIHNSDRLTFKNIHFYAGSVNFKDTDYLTVEDSKFSFSIDMGLVRMNWVRGNFHRLTNSIFEYINDGSAWHLDSSANTIIENVLFQYRDWFPSSGWQPHAGYTGQELPEAEWGVAPGNGNNPNVGDESWYAPVWRYVTVKDSWTGGIFAGRGSLVEYSRFENLYDGCDCSGIQRNSYSVIGSTSRYNWIINLPRQNGIRFDSAKGGNFGEIHHTVSVGNRRNLRIKGDYHEVYHTTTYNTTKKDIYYTTDKYAGFSPSETYNQGTGAVPGNAHSRLLNSTAGNGLITNVPDFWPSLAYVKGRDEYDPNIFTGRKDAGVFWEALQNNPNYLIDQSGIWYGMTMQNHSRDKQGLIRPWSDPILELENPWNKAQTKSESNLIEEFGFNPLKDKGLYSEDGHFFGIQSYDFRPKKGSSLIDNGVVIPGLNDGGDKGYVPHPDWGKDSGGRDFNHGPSYAGQHRPYIGEAPDIGAYEYGDSVYWIPGFRYPHPSVPIPNDGAKNVPLEYGLAWNYPYKKDYSNTKAVVSITGSGSGSTKTFIYPNNVFFASLEPNSTYTWTVTVDGVNGGTWSFSTTDKIYPVNDRSVDVTSSKIVFPNQKPSLEVIQNKVAFLLFDIPETIPDNYKVLLNLTPNIVSNLDSGIGVYKYANANWSEINNDKNIGTADHTLGELIHNFRNLKKDTQVSLDITDIIGSNSGDFSLALAALGESDAVSFYSKEKLLDSATGREPIAEQQKATFVLQYDILPNISFTKTTTVDVIAPNKGDSRALTVNRGSGSGFYKAGEKITISTKVPEGTKFSSWSGNVTGITDVNSQTTTLTVPETDLQITASYDYIVGNIFWTGLADDSDITNSSNWSNNLNPTEKSAWQAGDLGVVALLDNGDETDSHVITGSSYHWSDADLLLKADTVLKTYNPIFHSGGDITLQDRSFIDAEKHFILGRNDLPSQLTIAANSQVQIGSRLYLYSGSLINQSGGKVALINNSDSGRLHLYDDSIYSISSGRLEIGAPGNEIRIKNSISSTDGYINLTKDSTGEIYFRDLTLEEIIAYIGSGGIRIDNYDASSHADPTSYFNETYEYISATKVLRLGNGIVLPTISGIKTQGETLTIDTSNITNIEDTAIFSYQWFRGDSPLAGAVSSTYQLTQEDIGFPISATVGYTDKNHIGQFVTSLPTSTVININELPTGSIALNSYYPPEGKVLTVDTSSIVDPDGIGPFSYQWHRQGSPIAGATESSYTLSQLDVGSAISVSVTYTDQHGTVESVSSTATRPVRSRNINTGEPPLTINGIPVINARLSAVLSEAVVFPADTDAEYQWLRNGSPIADATFGSYRFSQDDVGAEISLSLSYADTIGEDITITSPILSDKTDENSDPTGSVTITGTATEGETLSTNTTSIGDGDGLGDFSYQWIRGCGCPDKAGDPIANAVASSYTLTQSDVGSDISVIVSWIDKRGTTESLTSVPTPVVTRTVTVVDTVAPVITLTGSASVSHDLGTTYTDAGATSDGGETVTTTGTVNVNTAGTYTLTYSASDAAGNVATSVIRTVTVVADTTTTTEAFGDVVVYANNSATLIGQVTIDGEVAGSGDVVAVYVGSELRGKQEVIISGGVAWVNAQVNAKGGEETISFKVWDSSTGVTHEKSGTSAVITTGGAIGSSTSPLMIEMKDSETQTLSLKAGWNLVSFYVEASDMTAATVLAPISSSLLQIKNLTSSYDPSIPSFLNTLSSLSVKDGYWVKVSEDVSLDVEGTVPSGASISVKEGWNLVGYPRSSGEGAAGELASLGSTVVQIKNLQSSYDPSIPSFLNTLSTMAPGSGYWLKVTADGTWTVGTVSESGSGRGLGKMGPVQKMGWGPVVVYPHVSATVLSEVSVGGKPVSKGSVVGAFVGEELRGEHEVVLANGKSYATLNVNLTGKERVTFRIQEAARGKVYRVAKVMELGLGETYGRAEALVKLNAVMTGTGVTILSYTRSPFGFSFDTGQDKSYTVEATGNLLKWNRVETFQGTGSAVQFTDTREALFEEQYYRVRIQE